MMQRNLRRSVRRSPTVPDDMPETGQRAADPTELTVVSSRVSEWTKAAFNQYDALVFVGAAAIAVRSIAHVSGTN